MSNLVSSWSTPGNLKKKVLTFEFCGKFANLWRDFFFGDRLRYAENFERRRSFLGEHFRVVSLVLGLERVFRRKVCPWPRIFFVFLALALSLVSWTPPLLNINGKCVHDFKNVQSSKIKITASKTKSTSAPNRANCRKIKISLINSQTIKKYYTANTIPICLNSP